MYQNKVVCAQMSLQQRKRNRISRTWLAVEVLQFYRTKCYAVITLKLRTMIAQQFFYCVTNATGTTGIYWHFETFFDQNQHFFKLYMKRFGLIRRSFWYNFEGRRWSCVGVKIEKRVIYIAVSSILDQSSQYFVVLTTKTRIISLKW